MPLLAVIRDAFLLPWKHRTQVLRTAGLPLLVLIGFMLARELPIWGSDSMLFYLLALVECVIASWLAITLHRLVLLDESRALVRLSREDLLRIARYALVLIGLWVAYLLVMTVVMNGIGLAAGLLYVPQGEQRNETAWQWVFKFAGIAALLPVARLGLLLPAIAVDRPKSPAAIWRGTRGNTLRLAVVFGLLPWAIVWCMQYLLREDASRLEYALVLVAHCLLTVCEVVAISLSYGSLMEPSPPPTDPPG